MEVSASSPAFTHLANAPLLANRSTALLQQATHIPLPVVPCERSSNRLCIILAGWQTSRGAGPEAVAGDRVSSKRTIMSVGGRNISNFCVVLNELDSCAPLGRTFCVRMHRRRGEESIFTASMTTRRVSALVESLHRAQNAH